ncbi:MAG: hypothetical protein ACTSU5_19305 [Promethearchaeota archaeon]
MDLDKTTILKNNIKKYQEFTRKNKIFYIYASVLLPLLFLAIPMYSHSFSYFVLWLIVIGGLAIIAAFFGDRYKNRVTNIKAMILDKLDTGHSPINLITLAQELGISSKSFTKIIKRELKIRSKINKDLGKLEEESHTYFPLKMIALENKFPIMEMKLSSSSETPNPTRQPLLKKEILDNFKGLVNISNRLKIDDMAAVLEMSRTDLIKNLLDWSEEFNFKINGEYVDFDASQVEEFIKQLDQSFEMWEDSTFKV